MIRIYEFDTGIIDWVAASSVEEAIDVLTSMMDIENSDIDDYGTLDEQSLEKLTYHDDSGSRSFKEELDRRIKEGQKFPQFFATSEY